MERMAPRRSSPAHAARPPARPPTGRHRRPRTRRRTGRGRIAVGLVVAALVGTGTLAAAHGAGPGRTVAGDAAPPLHLAAGGATASSARTSAAPAGSGGVPVAVSQALTAAGGSVSVAVFDAVSGRSWSQDDRTGQVEASISKLQILGAWLRDQQAGRSRTPAIAADLRAMIASSSNTAADALFGVVGRSGLTAFTAQLGVTVGGERSRHFGLDTTSAADQVTIMKAYAYPNAVLTDASRAEAEALLANVEDDQHWGVSAGVPAGVDVDLKNGWLPLHRGWVVNSVGHVSGAGHDYVVAILSSGNVTEQAGIDRVQRVSAAVWAASSVASAAS